ncbi:MAG TPA: ABC transporter permease [Pseudonocardiaceae bacterium]
MRGFVFRRLLAALPVLLAVLTFSFLMMQLVPGDPVRTMLSAQGSPPTAAQEQALRHQLGLDQSLPAQYLNYLLGLAHGDLGKSVQTGQPVTEVIGGALPASTELAATALVFGLALGVALALLRALTNVKLLRTVLDAVPVMSMSLPAYWVALVLIEVFSFELPWFPATGDNGLDTLVLPAIAMALPAAGVIGQVLGNGLESALADDYVITARAKGASSWRVLLRHALRNASIPTVTLIGTTIGNLLAASVVAETVFGRQGLGRLTLTAITSRDLPVLQGMVALLGVVYVLVNLAVDLVYVWLDPRVTSGRRRR